MKYIMLETDEGLKLPIIFPEILTHCFVAGAMQLAVDCMDPQKDLRPRQLLSMLEGGSAKPVSAGFINLGVDVEVHGDSESLGGLKHNPADAGRVVMGDSIQFMPDSIVVDLLKRIKESKDDGT